MAKKESANSIVANSSRLSTSWFWIGYKKYYSLHLPFRFPTFICFLPFHIFQISMSALLVYAPLYFFTYSIKCTEQNCLTLLFNTHTEYRFDHLYKIYILLPLYGLSDFHLLVKSKYVHSNFATHLSDKILFHQSLSNILLSSYIHLHTWQF